MADAATENIALSVVVILADVTAPAYEVTVAVTTEDNCRDVVSAVCAQLPGVGLGLTNVVLVEILHGKVYETFYSPRLPYLLRVIGGMARDTFAMYQIPEQQPIEATLPDIRYTPLLFICTDLICTNAQPPSFQNAHTRSEPR
eukprot:m.15592 g.15592  ORF g.15592 m.15592 type:complete len:143 (-) comp8699_c0_seq2:1340-1768(-)